jgi:hypothetical protein
LKRWFHFAGEPAIQRSFIGPDLLCDRCFAVIAQVDVFLQPPYQPHPFLFRDRLPAPEIILTANDHRAHSAEAPMKDRLLTITSVKVSALASIY